MNASTSTRAGRPPEPSRDECGVDVAALDVVRVGLKTGRGRDPLHVGRAGSLSRRAVEPRRLVCGQRLALDQQEVRLLVVRLVVLARFDPERLGVSKAARTRPPGC